MVKHYIAEDPKVAKFIFGSTATAWFWLIVRLYVGWQWLTAGWHKLSAPAWIGENTGAAIKGFVAGALSKTGGDHPDVQGWYAWFLQNAVTPHAVFWSYLIVIGEILVGLALLVGIFTGIAAFFGAFMNFNFLLAGTVSVNPLLFLGSVGLILAWKVAGYWGLDRYVLPLLGTPWRPGKIFVH